MNERNYRGWTMWWYEVAPDDWSGTFTKPGKGSRKLWKMSEEELIQAMMRNIDQAEGVTPMEYKGRVMP